MVFAWAYKRVKQIFALFLFNEERCPNPIRETYLRFRTSTLSS